MAIEFARVEVVSRGSGSNACRSGAYNARSKITDSRSNITYNFQSRGDNVYHEILLPDGVAEKFKDLSYLMNSVEQSEKRKDSQLLKSFVIALPDDKELSLEDRIEITKRIVASMKWVEDGLGVVIDVHFPHDGEKNWHAHGLVLTRRFTKDGGGLEACKARDLNPAFCKGRIIPEETLLKDKARDIINEYFKELGLENRVDAISTVPGEHIGPVRFRSILNAVRERNELRAIAHLENIKDERGVLDRVTSRQAVFTEKDLIRAVKEIADPERRLELVACALKSESVLRLYDPITTQHKRAERSEGAEGAEGGGEGSKRNKDDKKYDYDNHDAQIYYTTKEVRAEEERCLRIAAKVNELPNFGDNKDLRDDVLRVRSDGVVVSEDQGRVLSELLLADQGLKVLCGRAGTGKSHVLGLVRELGARNGRNVIGLAPTHKAVEELQSKGFSDTDTVKGFLFKYKNGRNHVPSGSLIVVDEAGMIETAGMLELLKVVRSRACNIIFAGDERQNASIERGGMFEVFADRFGSSELSVIRRQDAIWGREMASCLARHDIKTGIEILRENKGLRVSENLEASMKRLINDYVSSEYALNEKLAITLRNVEVDALNLGIREALKERGVIGGESIGSRSLFNVTRVLDDGKEVVSEYAIGERILFTATDKDHGIKNGEFGTLTSVTKNQFVALLDNGNEVSFDPVDLHKFTYGYASTVYKAQGASIKSVNVLHNGVGNARNSYVALTRHVEQIGLYCNKEATKSVSHLVRQLEGARESLSSLRFMSDEDIENLRECSKKQPGVLERIGGVIRSASTSIADRFHRNPEYYEYSVTTDKISHIMVDEALAKVFEESGMSSAVSGEISGEARGKIRGEIRGEEAVVKEGGLSKTMPITTIPIAISKTATISDRLSEVLFVVNDVRGKLGSKDSIYYMDYAKASGISESEHEFLEYKNDLYITSLASLAINKGIKLGESGSKEFIREAQANFGLAVQSSYSYEIEAHNYLENKLKGFIGSSDKAEIYRILVRDVLIVHIKQLESVGLMAPSNHVGVVLDVVYNIINSYRAKSANKQDSERLSGRDQELIASKVYEKLCKSDWWNSESMQKIELVEHLTIMSKEEMVNRLNVYGMNDNSRSKEFVSEISAIALEGCNIAIGESASAFRAVHSTITNHNTNASQWREKNVSSGSSNKIGSYEYNLLREESNEALRRKVGVFAESISRVLLGEPNKYLSTGRTLRFGETGKIAVEIRGSRAGVWYDFSEDRGGDLFELVERENNCNFKEAKEYIKGVIGYEDSSNIAYINSYASETLYQQVRSQSLKEEASDAQKIKNAGELYNKASELCGGSVAVRYLEEHRKINVINAQKASRDEDAKNAKVMNFISDLKTDDIWHIETKSYLPSLIAFARNFEGKVTGGQHIYLDADSFNKADVRVGKRSFGKISGSFVNIWSVCSSDVTIIAEGVETALSIKEAGISEVKILCSLGVSNIKNYSPMKGEKILLCADNDGVGSSSSKAIEQARNELEDKGAIVNIVMPEISGSDFNDILKLEGAESVKKQVNIALEGLANGLDRIMLKITRICSDRDSQDARGLLVLEDHLRELKNIAPESLQGILDICKLEGSEVGLGSVDSILKNSKALKEEGFASFLNYHRKTLNDIARLNEKIDIKSLIEDLKNLGKDLRSKDALREQGIHIDSVLVKSFRDKVLPELKLISKELEESKSPNDVIQIMHHEKELYADIYKNYWNLSRRGFTESEHDKFMYNIVFHEDNPKYLENLERDVITLSKLDILPEEEITNILKINQDLFTLGEKIFKGCQDHITHDVLRDLEHIEINKSLKRNQIRFEDHKSYLEHRINDKEHGHYLVDTRPYKMLERIYKVEHQSKQEHEKELEMHKSMDKDHGMSM